jgi:peptidyl-tRNA hydrolase, PTH1 family
MKYLIVGLGNPGPEYQFTRHNIGFLVLDYLLTRVQGAPPFSIGKYGLLSQIGHKGRVLHMLKPTTYMNLSGQAVRYWLAELKIPVENLLVITDDLSLPVGKLRLRPKGSAGGHNGLRNIEELLGSDIYPRLRFGIGDSFPRGRQVDYVLANFPKDEHSIIEEKIVTVSEAVFSFATLGLEKTMAAYNS